MSAVFELPRRDVNAMRGPCQNFVSEAVIATARYQDGRLSKVI